MTKYYRRKQVEAQENLRAGLISGALATTVAAATFYLVRLFLSRESMEPGTSSEDLALRAGAEDED